MRKVIVFLMVICFGKLYSQNCKDSYEKIDSVFNSFIKFMKEEDTTVYYGNADTLCYYWEKRTLITDFLENITGIYLKRKKGVGNEGICRIETSRDFLKWEEWYKINKYRLGWIEDNKVIQIYNENDFHCLNYKLFYPSQIRFLNDTLNIPKSTPPAYIKELEENKGYLKPIEINLASPLQDSI